ncbi:uncharacterized protein LOC124448224 isoform X2 [Xenia sp. Carnegie-2017]|uniref:uncharacterized protein LOC124448224 isoform X2 n=1 Tax=Xenia sp. Carnegie-2017 TaxID=2897299 RepID=UPI001F0481DA|nr:uncharacterized protein LOC124448224 isoform X2 [Xenia sp. Carnegie-2017]XP_046855175.1 uncharacterized protein LOC124448224 isoform X2 [Xenia sp. Carnegie-2017]
MAQKPELDKSRDSPDSLRAEIRRLRVDLYNARMANEAQREKHQKELHETHEHYQNKITELEEKIDELKFQEDDRKLATEIQLKECLQLKGELCDRNCVLSCLVSICQQHFKEYLCGRHLEKIIIDYYISNIFDEKIHNNVEDLRCEAFIRVLQKCGIVSSRPMQFFYLNDMNEVDRFGQRENAWEYFTTMIQNNNFLLLGRFFRDADTEGHCVICQGCQEEKVSIVDPLKGSANFIPKINSLIMYGAM